MSLQSRQKPLARSPKSRDPSSFPVGSGSQGQPAVPETIPLWASTCGTPKTLAHPLRLLQITNPQLGTKYLPPCRAKPTTPQENKRTFHHDRARCKLAAYPPRHLKRDLTRRAWELAHKHTMSRGGGFGKSARDSKSEGRVGEFSN